MSGRGVVTRYYVYRATATYGFITPVFTLFLLVRGLSYTEIGILSAVLAVIVVGGEVPTGYVGDRCGRRASLLAGKCCAIVSLLVLVVAHSFPAFVVGNALWALALAFTSGSASAWLYETLRVDLDCGEFTRVKGRGDAVAGWATGVAMVVGSLLYGLSPAAPLVVAAVVATVSAGVLLTLPKNPGYCGGDRTGGRDDPGADDASTDPGGVRIGETVDVVRTALTRPSLRAFVPYVGLLVGVVIAANQYVQPVTVSVFAPTLSAFSGRVGLPEVAALGVLYAGFELVSSTAAYHAGTVEDRVGVRAVLGVVPPVVALALVVPLAVPALAIPVFVLMRAGRTLVTPIAEGYVNDRIDGAGRATVLSAVSMVYALARAPLALAAGVVADVGTPVTALAGLGVAFLTGVGVLLAVGSPLPEPDGERDSPADTPRDPPTDEDDGSVSAAT